MVAPYNLAKPLAEMGLLCYPEFPQILITAHPGGDAGESILKSMRLGNCR
jgi:hypothetical protein